MSSPVRREASCRTRPPTTVVALGWVLGVRCSRGPDLRWELPCVHVRPARSSTCWRSRSVPSTRLRARGGGPGIRGGVQLGRRRRGAGRHRSSALTGAATDVFLDEYTPSGTLVQSVALPTSAVGANRRVTMSGTATSEGALALSADGRYLTLAGFDADPGTAAVSATTAATVNRVVARVDGNGVVDSSTAITDALQRGRTSGVRSPTTAAASGPSARTAACAWPRSARPARRHRSTARRRRTCAWRASPTGSCTSRPEAPRRGVYAVGAGLPTTGGQTPTPLVASRARTGSWPSTATPVSRASTPCTSPTTRRAPTAASSSSPSTAPPGRLADRSARRRAGCADSPAP